MVICVLVDEFYGWTRSPRSYLILQGIRSLQRISYILPRISAVFHCQEDKFPTIPNTKTIRSIEWNSN